MSPLQAWRQARNLTQSDLANQAGIDRSILSLIESGQRPAPPSFATFLESITPGLADQQQRHYASRRRRVKKMLSEAA